MADYDYLTVSNGTGDAALMHVAADRSTGSTVITVDTVARVPTKFIATSGTLLASGLLSPASITNFKGHLSGSTLAIDSFEAGSSDIGNTEGQVIIIKPNTGWANRVASFIKNATGYGTPENLYASAFSAASAAISGAISAASAAISGAITVGGNLIVSGQSSVVSASTTSASTITPTAQIYDVTALSATAVIAIPSFGSTNGMGTIIRIKDNGTAQAISFASGYSNVSGLDTPTTTVAGKMLTIGAIYNSATSKWEIQGINQSA